MRNKTNNIERPSSMVTTINDLGRQTTSGRRIDAIVDPDDEEMRERRLTPRGRSKEPRPLDKIFCR